MTDLLFLDPNKHPYLVLSRRGNLVGRFSNLVCAAQSVVSKSKGGAVVVPDGKVIDLDECKKILDSWRTVKDYSKRAPTEMVA